MKFSLIPALALTVLAISLTGCMTTTTDVPPPAGTATNVSIKAWIDGFDVIKIKGNELWYEHKAYQLPGMWNGNSKPTYVNGTAWTPIWTTNTSSKFTALQPGLPSSGQVQAYLVREDCNPRVWIGEQPSSTNTYTLSIAIDDERANGPRWYDFKIAW